MVMTIAPRLCCFVVVFKQSWCHHLHYRRTVANLQHQDWNHRKACSPLPTESHKWCMSSEAIRLPRLVDLFLGGKPLSIKWPAWLHIGWQMRSGKQGLSGKGCHTCGIQNSSFCCDRLMAINAVQRRPETGQLRVTLVLSLPVNRVNSPSSHNDHCDKFILI